MSGCARRHAWCRAAVLAASSLVLLAGQARAAQPLTVWIDAVRRGDSGARDAALTRVLRASLSLHGLGPHRWVAGSPPERGCQSPCAILRIRHEGSRFEIVRVDQPSGQRRRATVEIDDASTPFAIGEALAIRSADLFDRAPTKTSPRVAQRVGVEQPPPPTRAPLGALVRGRSAPAGATTQREIAVDLGPALTIGLDSRLVTVGVELGATVQLWRWFAARAAVGYQDAGRGDDDLGTYRYRLVPLTLLAGAQWRWSRVRLGLFTGISLVGVWLRFEQPHDAATEALVGPTTELRLAVRVASRLHVAFAVRAMFAGVAEADEDNLHIYRLPGALLVASLGLSWSF